MSKGQRVLTQVVNLVILVHDRGAGYSNGVRTVLPTPSSHLILGPVVAAYIAYLVTLIPITDLYNCLDERTVEAIECQKSYIMTI